MYEWDVYTISSSQKMHGVKFRGRLRLYGLKNEINILAENATDDENCVRFAVLHGTNTKDIVSFILGIVKDAKVELSLKKIQNPVLSKLIVNDFNRYD